ncbi:hypothetical protein CYMTET_43653 [Cymbomonas tetramitiformis]|uniref:Uncharacterized protein n=1 Tax=Cymbomonas tetramitiformis TaxID=36881 RepID=A0AAE0C1R8_9CHLO|nr:hypothetical protein CYMTET_43653 [Cymbomonas tetramitiformis]
MSLTPNSTLRVRRSLQLPTQVATSSPCSSSPRTSNIRKGNGRKVHLSCVASTQPEEVANEFRKAVGRAASQIDDPILREAIKEPVAFFGGMFAGLLKLDLQDEPLREWVENTAKASGVPAEDVEAAVPVDIEEEEDDDSTEILIE